jgi:vitamin-K-epoxide reductase (warfarin-sensitive)
MSSLRVFFPLLGVAVALYALYVEYRSAADPDYEALCDISESIKCTKVLMSEYGHILSKWGVVGETSVFNVPNPVLGLCFYLLVLLWPFPQRWPVLLASFLSLLFSAYLAYILATVLKDFCLVCVSSYVVNTAILFTELLLGDEKQAAAAAAASPPQKAKVEVKQPPSATPQPQPPPTQNPKLEGKKD